MQQLYQLEIFIAQVAVVVKDDDCGATKRLTVKTRFGPKTEFIIREGDIDSSVDNSEDIVECDENGFKKWSRHIRIGKSYVFSSHADSMLATLSKFPLEVEVWDDYESEQALFVGVGQVQWDPRVYRWLEDTSDPHKIHEPIGVKMKAVLWAECCCSIAGDVTYFVRLHALGDSVITEYQQPIVAANIFCFRSNKSPTMIECERVLGDDINFIMTACMFESVTLEDPEVEEAATQRIEVCTELRSCANEPKPMDYRCKHIDEFKPFKKLQIEKVRMGDIAGPCGNTNCALAQKVKKYLRNLEVYKQQASGIPLADKGPQKECGQCLCPEDVWHRETCIEAGKAEKLETDKKVPIKCPHCEGYKDEKHCDGPSGPSGPSTTTNYLISTSQFSSAVGLYGQNYTVNNVSVHYDMEMALRNMNTNKPLARKMPSTCCCSKPEAIRSAPDLHHDMRNQNKNWNNNQLVYNVETCQTADPHHTSCMTKHRFPTDKDCTCEPIKPYKFCKTLDCDCIAETYNIATRKVHKSFCPRYIHKEECPVLLVPEEEEQPEAVHPVVEDEPVPLPYGLPPISLGPCQVPGKPCCGPDGFTKMFNNATKTQQPPGYTKPEKVCVSKEYERIQTSLKDYMKSMEPKPFKCVTTHNVDNEKRCCDDDQVLMHLTGKSCCVAHKLDLANQDAD